MNSENGFFREPNCAESCVDECSSSNWIAQGDKAGKWDTEASYTVTANCCKLYVKGL